MAPHRHVIIIIIVIIIMGCEVGEHKEGSLAGLWYVPTLFKIYIWGTYIYKSTEDMKGIKVGAVNVNNLHYVDDSTLIA